jgi:hypothetical protein
MESIAASAALSGSACGVPRAAFSVLVLKFLVKVLVLVLVLGSRFWSWGSRFWVLGSGFWVSVLDSQSAWRMLAARP